MSTDSSTHLTIERRSPNYWRVTFDHPPINTITATTADSGDSVHAVRRFRTRLLGGSAAADAELVANP